MLAVITGAGAGIGRAIAETFAAAGAAVMVSDLNAGAAQAVAQDIVARGGKAISTACDVTKEDDLVRLVQETTTHFGKLTELVSNAGGGGPKALILTTANKKTIVARRTTAVSAP